MILSQSTSSGAEARFQSPGFAWELQALPHKIWLGMGVAALVFVMLCNAIVEGAVLFPYDEL